MKMTFIIWTS